MADSSHEISVDSAIAAATSTESPSARALSRIEPPQNESGLFSGESVLNILKLIFAGAPLTEVLTIIARLVEAQGKGMFCTIWLLDKKGSMFAARRRQVYLDLSPIGSAHPLVRMALVVVPLCTAESLSMRRTFST